MKLRFTRRRPATRSLISAAAAAAAPGSKKAEYLRRVARVEQIVLDAGDAFPTIPQVDEMLAELRHIPESLRHQELVDELLGIRKWLVEA